MVKALITTLGEVRHDYKAKSTYTNWGYGTYNHYGSYGTVVKQSNNYHKPVKKIELTSEKFEGCELCGEISTSGCNHCTQEEPFIDTYSEAKKCACGEDFRSYGSGEHRYHHCYACGFYEDDLIEDTNAL